MGRTTKKEKATSRSVTLQPDEWEVLDQLAEEQETTATKIVAEQARKLIEGKKPLHLTYDLDALDLIRAGEATDFCTISASADDGRKAEITTDANGTGLWDWNKGSQRYELRLGTQNFSLARWTKAKARKELRLAWEREFLN